ncbi:MAG: ketopantoate reductase family protein [Christensenellales bacterium]
MKPTASRYQRLIWQKMFTNVSASVLTGVLQVPLGYIAQNPNAWAVCEALIREAVAVAAGEGLDFDAEQKIAEVREVCEKSPNGLTSIYADLHNGRRSEVDTISGSVVRASERNGVPAPTHRAMVRLVHAMEQKHQA